MHSISVLADAYGDGQTAGVILRWGALIAVGAYLVRRVVRRSFGPGFRRSPVGTALGLAGVAAGLIASTVAATGPDPRLATYKRNVVRACVAQNVPTSFCACLADDTIKQMDGDVERLDALDDRARRAGGNAATAPPELLSAVQTCAGKNPPAPA
jgi:hypothetical protein